MPKTSNSFVDETLGAIRGVGALLVGDRKAPNHFDFSRGGVVGSFVALLLAVAIDAYVLPLTGDSSGITASQTVILNAVLFALQVGVVWLLLRLMNRLDSFVPWLVVDNWANLLAAIATVLLTAIGVSTGASFAFFLLVVLVIEINTARLVMTLTTRQIVLFLVGQVFLVGFAFLLLVSPFVPVPPDAVSGG